MSIVEQSLIDSIRHKKQLSESAGPMPLPIAVVGVGLRLPEGITDINKLWNELCNGIDAIRDLPHAPWADLADRSGVGIGIKQPVSGAFLDEPLDFDAEFFGISPREARNMDPQHRLLLETAWEALENANIAADKLAGSSTGVFVGIGGSDYGDLSSGPARVSDWDAYSLTGTNRAMAAGRVSYFLRVHGPALSIDTTCSSSLVAVHQAVQSLRAGECNVALASGVNLVRMPWSVEARRLSGALSTSGRCRAFDAAADGFVLGEGVVTVALKRLDDAIRDRNPIIGLLRGSAINQDGPSNGQTAPNGAAQQAVISSALMNADVSPNEVGYVEAHGTGTVLGDPIELEALSKIYGRAERRRMPLRVGSVKTNFGHLESASGILSLVKALLITNRGQIPATLHQQEPNPRVAWDSSGLQIQDKITTWEDDGRTRIAGVSAFGLSGTNCHIIVSNMERVASVVPTDGDGPSLLVLSAKDDNALRELAIMYSEELQTESSSLQDFCKTAGVGRSQFRHRLALMANSRREMIARLSDFAHDSNGRAGSGNSGFSSGVLSARNKTSAVMLVMPGGSSPIFEASFLDLCKYVPVFAEGFDRVYKAAKALGVEDSESHVAAIRRFAVQFAFANMWFTLGVRPNVYIVSEGDKPIVVTLSGECSLEKCLGWTLGLEQGIEELSLDSRPDVVVMLKSDNELVDTYVKTSVMNVECLVLQIGGQKSVLNNGSGIMHYGLADCSPLGVIDQLARIYVAGHPISWEGLGEGAPVAKLPNYPLKRTSHLLSLPLAQDRLEGLIKHEHREEDSMDEIIGFLRGQLAELLGMDTHRVTPDQPMFELGADSMVFAGIIERISKQYNMRIEVRQLFEELHTIADVAEAIAKAHIDAGTQPSIQVAAEDVTLKSTGGKYPDMGANTAHMDQTVFADKKSTSQYGIVRTNDPSMYFDDVVKRYQQKTAASRNYAKDNQDRLANNRRFIVPTNRYAEQLRYPLCGVRSVGSKLWDADGNEFVDLSMGFGAHLLGHSPEPVIAAMSQQLSTGIQLGSTSQLAGEVAQLVSDLTGMERSFFCVSGTEAMMTAIRIARAATGKSKVVLFTHAYHGHSDGTLVTPPVGEGNIAALPMAAGIVSSQVQDTLVLPYGKEQALDVISSRKGEIAAVVVEPVQNANPGQHPVKFLRRLREITKQHGITLIFDEVLTGFRVAPGGCQELFGVRADLVAYGKCLAAGMPMAAVSGSREYIDLVDGGRWLGGSRFSDERKLTYTAGTYANHPLALSAASAVLSHLKDRGPTLQTNLNRRADAMADRLNHAFRALEVPIHVANFGSFFRFAVRNNFSFVNQSIEADIFRANLSLRGVYVAETGASFISTEHSAEDIEFIIEAATDAAREMKDAGCWDSLGGRTRKSAPFQSESSLPTAMSNREEDVLVQGSESRIPALSLSYFGDTEHIDQHEHLELLMEGAEFGDAAGLEAIWLPERHFHSFGGFSPNPAVLASAVAQRTQRLQIRAGSVAAPLHHPARIAEEWSMVDMLSGGRVGLSFASGWNDRDFLLSPGSFQDRHDIVQQHMDTVRRLWRGEELRFSNGSNEFAVCTYPRPSNKELPVWMTTLNNPKSFEEAGRIGAGILTNLLRQDIDELARNIALYRQARSEAGLDPEKGHVTVLMHTLLGNDVDQVKGMARAPLTSYLRAAMDLTGRMSTQARRADVNAMSNDDQEYLLKRAMESLLNTKSLIGNVEAVVPLVRKLGAIGVDEIACFVDFGASTVSVREGYRFIGELNAQLRKSTVVDALPEFALDGTNTRIVHHMDTEAKVPDLRRTYGPEHKTTPNQRLVWAVSQLSDEASSAYNLRRVLKLVGPLQVDALRTALQELVNRHDSLRASYSDDGECIRVETEHRVSLTELDLSDKDDIDAAIQRFLLAESTEAFDLARGPLIRASLLRIAPEVHLLCLTTHHVAIDGTAENILLNEIRLLYNHFRQGDTKPHELPEPRSFGAYLDDMETQLPGEADYRYWSAQLSDLPGLFHAELSRSQDRVIDHRGGRKYFDFPSTVLDAISNRSSESRATSFMVVLSAFMAFLGRRYKQDDVVVAVPVSRRSSIAADPNLVAYCANTLPIRLRHARQEDFAAVIAEVRSTLLDGFEHERFPWADMLKMLPSNGSWGRPTGITTVFGWDDVVTPLFDELHVEHIESDAPTVRFDLGLNVTHNGDKYRLVWDYNEAFFSEADVAQLNEEFQTFLKLFTQIPSGNQSDLGVRRDESVFEVLERSLKSKRDGLPLLDSGLLPEMVISRSLTLANRVQKQGVSVGDEIMIKTESFVNAFIALLGAFRVGAVVCLAPSSNLGAVQISDRHVREGEHEITRILINEWSSNAEEISFPPPLVESALVHSSGEVLTSRELIERVDKLLSYWLSEKIETPAILSETMESFDDWVVLIAAAISGHRVRLGQVDQLGEVRNPEVKPIYSEEVEEVAASGENAATIGEHWDNYTDGAEHLGEVLKIWREVLGNESLTAHSDFFEAGGSSMDAIQILARVKRMFGIRVSASTIFKAPTAEAFSRQMNASLAMARMEA
ncbi:MupA/Atu3671 family FMN-dependent luciferase-like monooxygenase [Paenibacillus xylanexedens]|uniref:MupA/Atu3671 family FMN-dependent luciferase-like monooxygenase n=1 Tax=Paenibacillus xylanexedens TaxID=528191 RepID=UPI003B0267D5